MFFLLKCNKNIQDFFQRSQNTELTAVMLTPKKQRKKKFFVCKKKSHQAGRLRIARVTTRSVVLGPDQEVHQRLGQGLQTFHEVQRETLRVCVQPLRVLRLRLILPWNTQEKARRQHESAVSVKTKATGATEPASAPKAKAKTLMTETSSLTVAMTLTGDDVKWCDMAGTNNKFTITMISCSTQKKGS